MRIVCVWGGGVRWVVAARVVYIDYFISCGLHHTHGFLLLLSSGITKIVTVILLLPCGICVF